MADATVTLGDETTSWSGLQERAESLAARLVGARAVVVLAHPTVQAMSTLLGALAAGVPVIPVSVDAGEHERAHVVADSGAELVIDGDTWRSVSAPSTIVAAPVGTALVLYTSGTTGPPKGVPMTHGAIAACITGLVDAWAWTPDDVLVHGLPLHHVHGLVLGLLGPMQVGSHLVHTGLPTPAAYAAASGSLYFAVPTVWGRVARDVDAARALRRARLLVSGSAALPQSVFDALAALAGQSPVERYGMTETAITVAARVDQPRRQGTVGVPLAGTSTRIVDEAGDQAPHDGHAIGELQVLGPTVFGGYLGNDAATTASFTDDGWFRTGDIAAIGPDGVHRLVGRASTDLIKSGGYRIGAGEIEDALLAHPAVAEAAVVGEPDDDLGQRIVAYVVATACTADELTAFVANRLTPYKRPRRVVFVDSLPRNAMGKVEKVHLGESPA